MRRVLLTAVVIPFMWSCRSTMKRATPPSPDAVEAPAAKNPPVAIGDGFLCATDKRGQGICLDSRTKSWHTLRAAGTAPGVVSLVAQSTVACGIGSKPPSLENRILCWQPQHGSDAILLSAKSNARIRSLSLQKDQVCALLDDGQVACGPLLAPANAMALTNIKNLRMIRSIRSGEEFSCALRVDTGTVFCWGNNSKGQLGLGRAVTGENEPIAIGGFSGSATFLDVGARHACVINEAGEVFCWGDNSDQQLATNNAGTMQTAVPQIVRGLPVKASLLALGEKQSCAQLIDGTVWCWGATGQLGAGTQSGVIPLRVQLPAASATIVASLDRTCSQLTTGDIFCWGVEPEVLAVPR